MKYYVCYKTKDKKPSIIEVDEETTKELEKLKLRHLCFGCINGLQRDDECLKILDIDKRFIGKYTFIEEGFQLLEVPDDFVIDSDSIIDMDYIIKFVVYSCKNSYIRNIKQTKETTTKLDDYSKEVPRILSKKLNIE